ncbi:MAG: methyltransferase domain-containing protein, partial [Chloroflexota bacterium]|nr:methyltransferase domain-containing protein [Chloroflexota bacterium]
MDLFFKLVAPLYDRVMGRHATESVTKQILSIAALADGGRVLDVGGGTGRIAAGLRVNGTRVVVLDSSRDMLAQARRKGG